MKHLFDTSRLVLAPAGADSVLMRTALLLMPLAAAFCAGAAYGSWKLNAAWSFAGDAQPTSFTIQIEPRPKGEVFTLDRIEADGRAISSSSIVYLDGKEREFRDGQCSGTQLSRRIDSQTTRRLVFERQLRREK
jgi:hypothetical protein